MSRKMSIQGFFLYLPSILIILSVVIYPMIYAFQTSFTNFRPTIAVPRFVGLTNYRMIIADIAFWRSI